MNFCVLCRTPGKNRFEAHFVESQESDVRGEIQRLHNRLDRIEQAIESRKD